MRILNLTTGTTLYIDGRFTFNDHEEFRSKLSKVEGPLTVDLSATTYIDSSALGMLLIARDKLKHPITLKGAQGSVLEVLHIASFPKLFSIV